MPSLTLQSLTIYQFKHMTAQKTFPFTADTRIDGDNFTGKTTIAEAIMFTLFGTTPSKSPRVDDWLPPKAASIRTQVDAVAFDGQLHRIVRERSRTKTTIVLDGLTCPNQETLTPLIGTIDQFQPAFFPLTMTAWKSTEARNFWSQLLPTIEPADVLAYLGDEAGPLQHWNPQDFATMDLTAEQTQKTIKQQTTERERLLGAIGVLDHLVGEARTQVTTATQAYDATAHAAAGLAVQTATEALQAITLPTTPEPDWAPYYAAITQAETQYQASLQAHPPGWQDPDPLMTRIQDLETLLQQHAEPPQLSDAEVTQLRQQYQQITETLESLNAPAETPLPAHLTTARQMAETAYVRAETTLTHHRDHPPEAPPATPICPTCRQPLPAEQQQALQTAYTTARTAWDTQLRTYEADLGTAQQARDACTANDQAYREQVTHDIAQRRATLQADRQRIATAGQQAAATYQTAQAQATTQWQQQHQQWTDALSLARTQCQAMHAHNAALPHLSTEQAETQRSHAQTALSTAQAQARTTQEAAHAAYRTHLATAQASLATARDQAQTYQSHADAWDQARQQLAQHETQHHTQCALLESLEHGLLQLERLATAITQYRVKQTEMEVQPLRNALTHTTIDLWKANKTTGNLTPIFQLLYDDKPVTVLSTAERLACAAELTFALTRLTDIVYPTFLDNAESSTHWPNVPGQRIAAVVVASAPLTVHAAAPSPQRVSASA